ncbi:LysM peptidoglycan-binding domain-containing M23 family metallopeptidase [Methylosinus sp. Sm6]|uniref:LysM peptidoglycan-binding domain-containing M23 family metallopeptidase n=1 Tax=Methylosinus sp. Sm6 TaxID=2866948 RepID=UPI001C997118|nr:LysM peptidoglycan-binding domain-containing M23 family metallopeptidase [Methylosinus sp. Sm6]MBY6241155.1 peptidoglycan DD-metalloendopeptidase family protein [Methylosinus sp. Sm6]
MFAAGAAGLLAGCSDATRFSDPMADPFEDRAPRVDRAPTGTIPPRTYAEAAPPRSVIHSRPLPPQQQQQPMAQAERYAPPPAPAAPAPAARLAGSYNHWNAEGGTPIVVSDGETAGVVATRYGVPLDALLRVNGYSRPTEIHPGSRLVIPVYRAGAAPAAVEPARVADMRDRLGRGGHAAEPTPERSRAIVAVAHAEKRAPVVEPKPEKPKAVVAEAKIEKPKTHPVEAKVEKPKAQPVVEAKAEKPKPQPAEAKAEKPKPQIRAEAVAPAKVVAAAHAEPARKAAPEPARKVEADRKVAAAESARKERPVAPKDVAKAEPRKLELKSAPKAEPKAREQVAKKEPPAPAPEPKRQAAVEKAEKKIAAAPQPAQPAQRIDRTPVASLPPAQQQAEEKPAPATAAAAVAAAADAHPEFRWPARGRIIQGFNSGGNDGINIAVPEGTQVKAAEGGVVAYAGNELKGYGNLVLIRHPNGFVSAYAHNGELDVKRGDQVKRGQTIAKSGQSGNVGTPQLHFELRKGATPVDPTGYLAGL